MKKIESLTKEQEISLPNFVDKWVGYASEPIDYKRLEKSVEEIYKLMGKKKPGILIARNPYEAVVTVIALQVVCKDSKAIDLSTLRSSTLQRTLDSSTLERTLERTLGKEKQVDVYEAPDGTLFVHVEEEAEVKCVLEERHDTQVLPAGDYIVRRKVEYDHLLHTKKVVAD